LIFDIGAAESSVARPSTINSNNWNSSIDLEGSTPGRINSISPKDYDLSIKLDSDLDYIMFLINQSYRKQD